MTAEDMGEVSAITRLPAMQDSLAILGQRRIVEPVAQAGYGATPLRSADQGNLRKLRRKAFDSEFAVEVQSADAGRGHQIEQVAVR